MDGSFTIAFDNARLAPKLHHPATFLERGVALPLTTPLLAGSRARPAEGYRLELIILNPAGGRGVYILPWSSIGVFCRPTMHDAVFAERIAARSNVTPAIIRRIARQIAIEGLAGEDAQEAARAASEADKGDLILANYQLLMLLFEQFGQDPQAFATDVPSLAEDPAVRLRMTVDLVATRIARPPEWTAAALEQMAEVLAGLGLGESGTKARLGFQMDWLRRTVKDIERWATARQDETVTEYNALIRSVASLTLTIADKTIAAARALTTNMEELLRGWAADPDRIRELAGRPEWLLDGWERICVIWDSADDVRSQEHALAEIVGLIPVMPKEVSDWAGVESHLIDREILRHRRIVPFNKDWLTGESVFDLIARNERIRAAIC